MRHYQLTFNKASICGYGLEELYNRNEEPTEDMETILECIYEELDENFSCGYAIINMEKGGKKNHIHITAYVQIKYQPRTMKAWQKMFPEHPHVEECRGDSTSNIDYLYKRNTEENEKKHDTLRWGPFIIGEPVYIPAKVTPEDTAKKIQSGMQYHEMAYENPHFLLKNPYGVAEAIRSRNMSCEVKNKRESRLSYGTRDLHWQQVHEVGD